MASSDWANEEPRRPLEDASRSSNKAEIASQDKVVNSTVQRVGKKVLTSHHNDDFPFQARITIKLYA